MSAGDAVVRRPPKAPSPRARRRSCLQLARRAYRGTETEDDLGELLAFYESRSKQHGFEAGIQTAIERLLSSPKFLFRIERNPRIGRAGLRVSADGYRACFAPVVLPVEQHSGRRAAGAGRGRQAVEPEGVRGTSRAHARGPESGRARRQFRRPVALPAKPRRLRAELRGLSEFRRQPCARGCGKRPSSSSRASSKKIAASSI